MAKPEVRYATALLVLTYVLHAFDRGIIAVVIQPIAETLHLNDAQIGMLAGLAYGVAYALCSLPVGLLVDRVERRRLLALLLALWSGMTLLSGFANSFLALLACRAVVGAAEAGGSPATIAMTTDLHPPTLRSRMLGFLYVGNAAGAAASAVAGGYVAQRYGWHLAFLFAGLPGLVVALLLATTIAEPKRGVPESGLEIEGLAPSIRDSVLEIVRAPGLLWIYAAIPGGAAATSIIGVWTVPFLVRIHHVTLTEAGLLFALILSGGLSIGAVLSGWIADRLNRQAPRHTLRILAIDFALSIPVTWAAFSIGPTWLAVALLLLANVMLSSFIAPALGFIMTLAGPTARGLGTSIRDVLIFMIGFGVAPYLVGMLSVAIGGTESLRWALMISISASALWSTIGFLVAAFHVPARLIAEDLPTGAAGL